jgi:hypothetical protein
MATKRRETSLRQGKVGRPPAQVAPRCSGAVVCWLAVLTNNSYLGRITFEFCLPTKATTVPSGPDWLHEVKYDGYRLRLERDGERVRLITRGGHNWTKPTIRGLSRTQGG